MHVEISDDDVEKLLAIWWDNGLLEELFFGADEILDRLCKIERMCKEDPERVRNQMICLGIELAALGCHITRPMLNSMEIIAGKLND